MRLHRFYIDPKHIELKHELWINDVSLRNQWLRVLRYKTGDDLVLFDGISTDRLYKIDDIESDAIKLKMVTDFERKLVDKHVYLFFSLLKKDKNDWTMQKCTELGVKNFVPIMAARSEKLGFNLDRAKRIVIEASEQCGRSDIPQIREPINLETALNEYKGKVNIFVAEGTLPASDSSNADNKKPSGVFIGPEGGWTEEELGLFSADYINNINLGNLTLRAETACILAASKLIG